MKKFSLVASSLNDFEVNIPGSKSITNRFLLLGALSRQELTLENFLDSDDTKYMCEALQKMGVVFERISSTKIKMLAQNFELKNDKYFLGNAGTATRFLTAALSVFGACSEIDGNQRMRQRPIGDLTDALSGLGVNVEFLVNDGFPPLKVQGPWLNDQVWVNGSVSSQYFSAILMAAPLVNRDIRIHVNGELVSKPYVQITLMCMKKFGIEVQNDGFQSFFVKSGQHYLSPKSLEIEPDASAASYFWSLGFLHGVKAKVKGLNLDSVQGDIAFVEFLKKMGAEILYEKSGITVSRNGAMLTLGDVDLNDIPDVAMTLAVLSAVISEESYLKNIANLRVKETDRLAALAQELKKLGVNVCEEDAALKIRGPIVNSTNVDIETYDDHRMAMCFAVLASKYKGINILDPDCVNKTYPDFWKDFAKIGLVFN